MSTNASRIDPSLSALPAECRPRYAAPRLRRLGDLRGHTFGPSIGTGESGNQNVFRVFLYEGELRNDPSEW